MFDTVACICIYYISCLSILRYIIRLYSLDKFEKVLIIHRYILTLCTYFKTLQCLNNKCQNNKSNRAFLQDQLQKKYKLLKVLHMSIKCF